jgi:hypothetical protein
MRRCEPKVPARPVAADLKAIGVASPRRPAKRTIGIAWFIAIAVLAGGAVGCADDGGLEPELASGAAADDALPSGTYRGKVLKDTDGAKKKLEQGWGYNLVVNLTREGTKAKGSYWIFGREDREVAHGLMELAQSEMNPRLFTGRATEIQVGDDNYNYLRYLNTITLDLSTRPMSLTGSGGLLRLQLNFIGTFWKE